MKTNNVCIKNELGYFQPVTSNMGLKELKWQQMPFSKEQLFNKSNKDVSRETLNQIELYLLGSLQNFSIPLDFSNWSPKMVRGSQQSLKCRMGKLFLIKNSLMNGATLKHLGLPEMLVNETRCPS